MLTFQRNALRPGDRVFVRDARNIDLGLRAGVATLVDVRPFRYDVGIRLTTGTRTQPVVRPGRSAVHLPAVDDHDCWRCRVGRTQQPVIGVAAGSALSGVR